MKDLRGHLPYPLTLVFALGVCLLAERGLGSWPIAASLAVGAAFVLVAFWEWWLPHESTWRPDRRSLSVNIVHAVVTGGLLTPAVRVGLGVAIAAAVSLGVRSEVGSVWPTSPPLAVQVLLAVAVADLGAYGAHRWMHLSRAGWRIHVVHHSPPGLSFVASARSHPFNAMLTYTWETGLLVLLGVPTPVLALWSVMKATNGLLQHANVAFSPTPLAWVLATPEIHRWHHSVHLDESNTNFGNTTTLWDRVFGTLHLPSDRQPGTQLGVEGTHIPENYWSHLATPFVLARFESVAEVPEGA